MGKEQPQNRWKHCLMNFLQSKWWTFCDDVETEMIAEKKGASISYISILFEKKAFLSSKE